MIDQNNFYDRQMALLVHQYPALTVDQIREIRAAIVAMDAAGEAERESLRGADSAAFTAAFLRFAEPIDAACDKAGIPRFWHPDETNDPAITQYWVAVMSGYVDQEATESYQRWIDEQQS